MASLNQSRFKPSLQGTEVLTPAVDRLQTEAERRTVLVNMETIVAAAAAGGGRGACLPFA